MQRLLDAAPDVVADHQTSEQNAIYHDYPFTQVLCSFLSRCGEIGGCDEESFGGLVPVQAAEKVTDCSRSDGIALRIAPGL